MSDYRLPGTPDGTETAVVNPTFLLGFGALDEENIREGIRRLYEAWKS
jgi:DNA-binding transcriptional MocR family regulator